MEKDLRWPGRTFDVCKEVLGQVLAGAIQHVSNLIEGRVCKIIEKCGQQNCLINRMLTHKTSCTNLEDFL